MSPSTEGAVSVAVDDSDDLISMAAPLGLPVVSARQRGNQADSRIHREAPLNVRTQVGCWPKERSGGSEGDDRKSRGRTGVAPVGLRPSLWLETGRWTDTRQRTNGIARPAITVFMHSTMAMARSNQGICRDASSEGSSERSNASPARRCFAKAPRRGPLSSARSPWPCLDLHPRVLVRVTQVNRHTTVEDRIEPIAPGRGEVAPYEVVDMLG